MIKAVIFDLWDTLIPVTIDFVHLASLVKRSGISIGEFVKRYESAVQTKKHKSFEKLRNAFFSEFGEGDNELLDGELYEIFVNRFDKVGYFHDAESALSKLKKRGYILALLTNTESLHSDSFEKRLRFREYFGHIVYSFEVGAVKPDKRMFFAALEALKLEPEECLMVGDSVYSDIVGANSVGMHSCRIRRPNDQLSKYTSKVLGGAKVEKPEYEISSLGEIFRVLGTLNKNSEKEVNGGE